MNANPENVNNNAEIADGSSVQIRQETWPFIRSPILARVAPSQFRRFLNLNNNNVNAAGVLRQIRKQALMLSTCSRLVAYQTIFTRRSLIWK